MAVFFLAADKGSGKFCDPQLRTLHEVHLNCNCCIEEFLKHLSTTTAAASSLASLLLSLKLMHGY